MKELVQKLVTEDSFDATGSFVPAGRIGAFDPETLTGKEPHLHDVGDFKPAVVEMSALSPTGPNPTTPQQIPPDALQTAGGGYARAGATLVSEVTQDDDQRFADRQAEKDGKDTEGQMAEALREAREETARVRAENEALRASRETTDRSTLANVSMADVMGGAGSTTGNADDALVSGTVADVTADLGGKSDADLAKMEAAENDREKPRAGVLKAIEAERESRKANS